MLRGGINKESDSPWYSPVLLVTKEDGTYRFVVNFMGFNALAVFTSWPLPTLGQMLDSMAERRPSYFSALDLRSGY